ncbi:MAG: AAA family ATPase [Thermomicrobiales bacterium]
MQQIAEVLRGSDFDRPHSIEGNLFSQIVNAVEAILDLAPDQEERYGILRTRTAVISLAVAHYRDPERIPGHGTYLVISPDSESEVRSGLVDDLVRLSSALQSWLAADAPTYDEPKRVYIPTLRSAMRMFGTGQEGWRSISTDVFAATIIENYDLKDVGQLEVFTGNLLYATVHGEFTGNATRRARLAQFERFLSRTFFSGTAIQLIPMHKSDDPEERLHIYIAGDDEYHLHHVGDGIQALIILMYRLFTADDNAWIFIEEPEINLHPGLQRIFIDAVIHDETIRAKNLRVFMTTHSNHLLGTLVPEVTDVAVFSLQVADQPRTFLVRPVVDRDHNPMALLGVTNSSVFLANCAIWVEGVSDRLYLRAYLKAYQESSEFQATGGKVEKKVMREDIHYAFLEFAGSNLSHYLFAPPDAEPMIGYSDGHTRDVPTEINALAISNRIFLLADQDVGKEEKHERLFAAAAKSEGNFEYHTTAGIEIENMIPAPVLRVALRQLFPRCEPAKIDAATVDEISYASVRLGEYLKTNLGKGFPVSAVAQSGTLETSYKTKLARAVTDIIGDVIQWEDLSEPVQQLAINLYSFIAWHSEHPLRNRPIPEASPQ